MPQLRVLKEYNSMHTFPTMLRFEKPPSDIGEMIETETCKFISLNNNTPNANHSHPSFRAEPINASVRYYLCTAVVHRSHGPLHGVAAFGSARL